MGALLKEAAREAANSSSFYRMFGRSGLAEGDAGEKCHRANSSYCFRGDRRDRTPRSPYFGKTLAANRSVFLRHLHRFSCHCSPLLIIYRPARNLLLIQVELSAGIPWFLLSATSRVAGAQVASFTIRSLIPMVTGWGNQFVPSTCSRV